MALDVSGLSQPHNNLMLAILSDPARAGSLLRASLPASVMERLSEELPVPLEGSFVDEQLRASRSDKLFELRYRNGGRGLLYVLLEHKSRSDPGTALQIEKYKTRIWEDYAQGKAERLRALPPILPLVIYHGKERWTAPRSVAEMLAEQDEEILRLESQLGYYLRDLGEIPVEQLAEDAATRAGLAALRYSRVGSQAEKLAALAGLLAGLPEGTAYGQQVVLYILSEWQVPVPELLAVAGRAESGKGGRIVGSVVQELINQGKAEGVLLGKAEGVLLGKAEGVLLGKAEGRAEGKAESLTLLLQHRFGPLDKPVLRRIASSSLEGLDRGYLAALSERPLSEVLARLVRG